MTSVVDVDTLVQYAAHCALLAHDEPLAEVVGCESWCNSIPITLVGTVLQLFSFR